MDLSQPGDIAIAQIKGTDDLLIVSGDRRRSVRVTAGGVAVLCGMPRKILRMRDIRSVAPELLANPRLACGSIEMCEEMHDPERVSADPPKPGQVDEWVDPDADGWKADNGG